MTMRAVGSVVRFIVAVAGVASSVQGCAGEPGAPCDPGRLAAALAAARSGDTVRMGTCRVEGSFTVPAGVTLAGAGPAASTLATVGRRPAVRLTPGTPPSRLADLAVETDANSGILIRGAGTGGAAVERVDVRSTRGMALAAEDVATLALSDVSLSGPVTEANECTTYTGNPAPETAATHGLVLVRVGAADLADITATGFAGFGALLVESTTTWLGGGAPGNLGNGVMVHAGSARLEDLDLSGTLGECRLPPAYGGVFAAGASVQTARLRVSGGRNFGLLHDDAEGRHVDLVASGNGSAAVWAQNCPSLELSGAGTVLAGNGLAGVVAVDTPIVTVRDANIGGTRIVTRTYGEISTQSVGAGVELVRVGDVATLAGVTLENLTLQGNEQVGLLLHLRSGQRAEGMTIAGVTVRGEGASFGAVAQGGTAVAGWDAGVTREGATAANDASPHDPLQRVGALDSTDMPGAAAVADNGIAGVLDPDPPT